MTLSKGRKFWKLNSLVTLVKTTQHLLTEFNEYSFPQPKSPYLLLLLFLTWTKNYEDKMNIYCTELKIQVSTSNPRNI